MASAFTRDEVAALAALAQLELSPEEIELFARHLHDFLAYAETVQQIDTTGVPPTASVVSQGTDREDAVRPSLDIEDTLANAPDADRTQLEGGFFKVPRVL
jgi:aspartyl-tRNA(Asn)/glutamyl-tRNA(Gln) amidotransferase subunit C